MDVDALSAALVKKIDSKRQPEIFPATVQGYDGDSRAAIVLVDGDSTPISVISTIGAVLIDERVIVQFQPPQGVFIVGSFSDTRPLGILALHTSTSNTGLVGNGATVQGLGPTITVPSGRRVIIHFHCGTGWGADNTNSGWIAACYEDGIHLEDFAIHVTGLTYAQGGRYDFSGSFPHNPTAGTHTYNVLVFRYLGVGNLYVGANSTTSSMSLWVEDVGAA